MLIIKMFLLLIPAYVYHNPNKFVYLTGMDVRTVKGRG